MKAASFKELYQSKTDEELLSLASEKDTLVGAAQDTLLQELRRRGLSDDSPATATAATTAKPDSQSEEKTYPPKRSSFVWLGLFLLNSIVVYECALHLSPVLVGRWFAWVSPQVCRMLRTPARLSPNGNVCQNVIRYFIVSDRPRSI